MDNLETITAFFGWCTVINVGFLAFGAIKIVGMRGPILKIHGKMFGLSEEDLSRAYFQYLVQYKIAVIVFNLVPYIALRSIA
jgi:hypothetical protein